MLYLQVFADSGETGGAPLPIREGSALALERAILASREDRLAELNAALEGDENVAAWALALAEKRLGRTVNQLADAASWLESRVERELATALVGSPSVETPRGVDWRLPRLVALLSSAQEAIEGFEGRLERAKLESLKELAYGASHEINNPLANIAARAQLLVHEETNADRRQKLSAIHRQAMRAHEMISDLMLFARPPKLCLEACDLVVLTNNVVHQQESLAAELGVKLRFDAEVSRIDVWADKTQLPVAIAAIVRNGLEAVGEGGHVAVRAQQVAVGDRVFGEVLITDDGPGIPADVRAHLFEPFYSGREAGRGLGFGASKCWRIVTDHGGQVVVHSPSVGTEIAIRVAACQ